MLSRKIIEDANPGPAGSDLWQLDHQVFDEFVEERSSNLALVATIVFSSGAVALVVGLAANAVLTALLCLVLAVCIVGLAVAMK